ncbi:MAG: hypothetical protein UT34_C0002G0029 [candidate division WS6 bacterium GW2011_GWF2_39_15]|uniref:Fimbrial assembly family protein n=1 Tax=candidate division WS6 bacterium GW2011_GWF2_39_15 TaxID=1619100 RepID=A0A0G0QV45_9BACT|nr:MAG: hypothetical protein UT34_C0002G0029 [candidate division WS6 bacterium GW2011_GWF2_39_15]
MSVKSKKTINLLDSIGTPSDTWTAIYLWVFNIGRYIMLGIEIVVLAVFFSRFVLDKQNHDLTEEINDKTVILSNKAFRDDEVRYRNLQTLLSDVTTLSEDQPLNSEQISALTSAVPNGLTLDKFAFSDTKVSMSLLGSKLNVIKDYEFSLRQNPRYKNVNFTVSRSGINKTDFDVSVSFALNFEEDQK